MYGRFESKLFLRFILSQVMMISALAQESNVDCTKKMNAIELRNCCKVPELSFDAYDEQCQQFRPNQGLTSPCHIQCVLNASSSIIDDELNLENTRKMFSSLINGDEEFIELFTSSFEKCEPKVKQKYSLYKSRQLNPRSNSANPNRNGGPNANGNGRRNPNANGNGNGNGNRNGNGNGNRNGNGQQRRIGPNGERCSPLATFYAMCANENVFLNCPESAWTASAICENAKRQVTQCENSTGQRRTNGARRFPRRRG